MTNKILCVDDDPNILMGYQRALRAYKIEVSLGAEEALAAIRQGGPYAIVVSDMRMPRMNGVEFLTRVKEIAPETVRIMLTGNSDQQTALDAVNDGHIFRFLTKPCPAVDFAKALEAGLAQYRLIVAERELLSRTLCGSVRMLTELLSLASPAAFGRASRVLGLTRQMSKALHEPACWKNEIAAMLSQIGCVAISGETLTRVYRGEELSPSEAEEFAVHPLVGRDLLENIPRLEDVAEIIAYQEKRFNGEGPPADDRRGKAIPLGSRILKVALDFDTFVAAGNIHAMAVSALAHREGWYDPDVLAALCSVLNVTRVYPVRQVKVYELADGMILANDVRSKQGTLLCAKGHEVNRATRFRLKNYECNIGIRGPIQIFPAPVSADEDGEPVDGPQETMARDMLSFVLED